MIKLMLSLGKVWLSKGWLCPTGLGKGKGYGPTGLESHAGAKYRGKKTKLIFNNHRSSNLPLNAPYHKSTIRNSADLYLY